MKTPLSLFGGRLRFGEKGDLYKQFWAQCLTRRHVWNAMSEMSNDSGSDLGTTDDGDSRVNMETSQVLPY